MSEWCSRPNREPDQPMLQLKRCPTGKGLTAIVTGDDLVGHYTHYWRGRTTICRKTGCEPCSQSRTPRWYGFLDVWSPSTNAIAMFELTPTCIEPIDRYLAAHGTLRGSKITIQRATAKVNSRLICTIEESQFSPSAIPPAVDLKRHLAKMWELPFETMEAAATLQLPRAAGTR